MNHKRKVSKALNRTRNNNNDHPLLENTVLELRRGLIVLAVFVLDLLISAIIIALLALGLAALLDWLQERHAAGAVWAAGAVLVAWNVLFMARRHLWLFAMKVKYF